MCAHVGGQPDPLSTFDTGIVRDDVALTARRGLRPVNDSRRSGTVSVPWPLKWVSVREAVPEHNGLVRTTTSRASTALPLCCGRGRHRKEVHHVPMYRIVALS